MDDGMLPLAFYCRNAQLSLQKAAESRNANLAKEELQHLKAFTTLVTSSIPTHQQFQGWKDIQDIELVDLYAHIAEAKQRIRELDNVGHLDPPFPTIDGQKHAIVRPTSSRTLEPSQSASTKCATSLQTKLNLPLKSSSEVMLKTSKSVRITEAVSKQRPQRWNIAMTETYGVGKTSKPISLTPRLKRGIVEPHANSKALPVRAPVGKVDIARPSSVHDIHNPTSGEIMSSRPISRSRDSSRIQQGARSFMPPTSRGSTALKALTSSAIKLKTLDEECSQSLNNSNQGMQDSAENRANSQGCASTPSLVKSTSISKLANHCVSEGPWIKGILRNGLDGIATISNGAVAKSNLEDDKELITWIPITSQNKKSRVLHCSSDEDTCGKENLELESMQRDHDKGEDPQMHNRAQALREWKKGYVEGEQRLDELSDGVESQELWAHELSQKCIENWPAAAPIQRATARVIKGALPLPIVQRSMVKENCECFWRRMRILKEKAEDTRMKEEEVESMAERLQRQLKEETDLDREGILHNSTKNHGHEEFEEFCDVHRVDQPNLERTSLESLNKTMTKLMNGDYSNSSILPVESVEQAKKGMKTMTKGALISSTSSASVQSSLPLSHYIQKLKESQFKNVAGNGANQHKFEVMKHNSRAKDKDTELLSITISKTDSTKQQDINLPALSHGLPTLAPTSSSSCSPKGSHQYPPSLHNGKRLNSHVYHNTIPKSNSSLISMVQTIPSMGTMVAASYLEDQESLQDQQALCHSLDETSTRALGCNFYETAQQDANNEKIAHLQRVLGELRGSMEGVKIWIEAEGQGWQGHIDCLEKEVENLKEADEDIIEAQHNFKNELKMKLSKFMADTENYLLLEREQVQMMVEDRIQKHLKAQHLPEMKDEMHLLWNEMDSLIKSREDMASHIEHLTSFTKKVQEYSRQQQAENDLLRKQLQSLQDDKIQVRSEIDKEDLKQAVKKLKNDGNNMKVEIQGLKNTEKIVKVELVDFRTRLGKVQDETKELEREKEMTLVEGARERLLIMERVESLSQLYLGGLEEVRQDLGHVKVGFSERINEIESQWNDANRNQGTTCKDSNIFLLRQGLIDELDQFHSEIAEMVDNERGVLKETLEKESTLIWRKVIDAYANNKSEMLNMLKLEIQKQLHSAHEKVLLINNALKCDMDALKIELTHTQNKAKELTQIILVAEEQKEVAAQAASNASSSATKAKEILTNVIVSIESEVSNARLESMHLQEKLATEKNMAIVAASEARLVNEAILKEKETALATFQDVRQKSHELQDYLEKESPKLLTAMVVVQKERDMASQAAAEATSSAMKAGELLGEVLGSFNLEMAKARHINMQLQEELEHERAFGTQHSQEVQDRISKELEVAIANWKLAMNEEIVKARETAKGVSSNENIRQPLGFSTPLDLENYILKTEEKLNNLMTTVKQLQDSTSTYCDKKKKLKQQKIEQNKNDWTSNTNQLNQVVRIVEERVNETSFEQTELQKQLRRFEGIQTDLIHSIGEVRSNTYTLEKTVNLFIPQYDAAAQIVDNLSCKVEHLEEKVEGFSCNEGLAQTISRLAETKIESLKNLIHSNVSLQDLDRDLKVLQNCVENKDHSHCQAIAQVESRVAVVECTLSNIQNGGQLENAKIGSLTESVENSQRKMAVVEQNGILHDQDLVTSARVFDLENRVEHVATATFSNLQLLDNKVERVSTGVQSALEGAALAENKCGALGAELVKVFRMLTATKNSSTSANWPQLLTEYCNDDNIKGPKGRSLSPPLRRVATQRLESRSQSPPPCLNGNLTRNSSRGPPYPLQHCGPPSRSKAGIVREKRTNVRGGRNVDNENQSSELRKAEIREQLDQVKESKAKLEFGMTSQGDNPPQNNNWLNSYPRECLPFKDGQFSRHALTMAEQTTPYILVDRRAKNLQKTNIRLESGRIHVNVSRKAGAGNGGQSNKQGNALAVQS